MAKLKEPAPQSISFFRRRGGGGGSDYIIQAWPRKIKRKDQSVKGANILNLWCLAFMGSVEVLEELLEKLLEELIGCRLPVTGLKDVYQIRVPALRPSLRNRDNENSHDPGKSAALKLLSESPKPRTFL